MQQPKLDSFIASLTEGEKLFPLERGWSQNLHIKAPYWIHFDLGHEGVARLLEELAIDPLLKTMLLEESFRPRYLEVEEGILLSLHQISKGCNHDRPPGLRILLLRERIFTFSSDGPPALHLLLKEIPTAGGPKNSPDFLVHLLRLISNMAESSLVEFDHDLDRLEKSHNPFLDPRLSAHLADLRTEALVLRRMLIPERDVLIQLHNTTMEWFSKWHRRKVREEEKRLELSIETLELCKERAGILMDENRIYIAQSTNRGMYLFSLVAVLFLPISALTSLFGVNLPGIPWSESPVGFWILMGILAIIEGTLLYLLRRLRFF